jgi:hypothetical protein
VARHRFYFFSSEGYEPPHIHVDKAGNSVSCGLRLFGSRAISVSGKAI